MTEQFTVDEIIMNSSFFIKKNDLKSRPSSRYKKLLARSGCYVFLNRDDVQYVGCSGNLYLRIISHYDNGLCDMFDWTGVCFIFCDDYRDIEWYLINKFDPNFNNSKAGFSVTAESGTKPAETRATFIVNKENLDKLKALAYWERTSIKKVVAEMVQSHLDKYEKKNGIIKINKKQL